MTRPVARFAVCLFGPLLAIILVPANAFANNWFGPTGGTGCTAGNMIKDKTLEFTYVDPRSETSTAMNSVRINAINPTVLSSTYNASPDQYTEITLRDLYYTDYCELEGGWNWAGPSLNGVVGLATCDRLVNTALRCAQATARITEYVLDEHGSGLFTRSVLCHEVGHNIGLKHREGIDTHGCMSVAFTDDDNYTAGHDETHFANLP